MQQSEEPEQQLQQLLQQLEAQPGDHVPQKFRAHFQKKSRCSLENFAIYFLAALRQHTELHFRASHSNESETPQSQTPVRRVVKPAPTDPVELNESQLSNLSISNVSSTPVRQQAQMPQARRSTNSQFCSTPQSSERSGNRSGGGSGAVSASSSFCLRDFMLSATPNQSHQRSKKKLTPGNTSTPQQDSSKTQKPRRRVLPMTISKNVSAAGSSFGDTSSFSNENNLLRLSQSCELDRSQVAVLEQEARKTLLLHKQEIKTEAAVASVEQQEKEPEVEPNLLISLEHVSHTQQLRLLAAIYAQLMDLNLVPNVLSELSYALQLLNIRATDSESPQTELSSPLSLLCRRKECVYFAVQLLEQQKELLLQLDRKSLAVLLQHERLTLLPQTLQEQLELTCQSKRDSNKQPELPQQQQNVYYQHDKDSRDNFPSQHEFSCFKSQRDLFYKALKQWETSHLNRMFNFSLELGPRVREIFKQSEHAVNMSHFAKLFVSQLLMSSGETHESPEELGLKLDQQRLNRLAQRLVTSNSSEEDQFPRSQAFFRDFISGCGSVAFLVQLQLALYVQLLRHNDSSFELLQLQPDEEETAGVEVEQVAVPYVVRPQAMAELLMLAKFLGYVYALPYNRAPATIACPQQLQLRRQFQPPFEMQTHLERAMQQGKLLITLPWLVQYLTMLDLVSLQLPGSLATLELLFDLYSELATPRETLHPCAMFITRSCLGWLLESQPALSNGYYTQRSAGERSQATAVLVQNSLRSLCFADKGKESKMLEELLPVACPFLHEFRVSITPSQRQAQRNGRYRYITTRIEQLGSGAGGGGVGGAAAKTPAQLVDSSQLPEQQQLKLTEAFLHSQNASMRRLLEFVAERSFKCVVKDAQQKILLPAKSAADAQVNGISSTQQQVVLRELQRIYQQAWTQACQQWEQQVPAMLNNRIGQSLLALLPENTNEVVRAAYSHLIRQQAQTQLQQWLQTNVLQSTFYHGDLQEVASKVCRSNKNNAQVAASSLSAAPVASNEMCLTFAATEPSLSQLLHELHQWMHCLSLRPEQLRHLVELQEVLKKTCTAALLPQLPTYFYELLGSSLVRLLQLLICRQPQMFTPALISLCCDVWMSPHMHPKASTSEFLKTLLSVSFVSELSMNLGNFQLMQQLLHAMLDAGVLDMDELNQLFVPLFKETWSPPIWNALSQLLQQVSQNRGDGDSSKADDDAKSHLFMEMLADLSRDLDSF